MPIHGGESRCYAAQSRFAMGCEEVLAVPTKAKKGTKKKATPKKK